MSVSTAPRFSASVQSRTEFMSVMRLAHLLLLRRDDAAVRSLLPLRKFALWERCQSGIMHPRHRGMLLKPLGDDLCVGRVLLDAEGQCFQATQGKPCFLRRLYATDGLAHEPESVEQYFVASG